eukprot:464653_1
MFANHINNVKDIVGHILPHLYSNIASLPSYIKSLLSFHLGHLPNHIEFDFEDVVHNSQWIKSIFLKDDNIPNFRNLCNLFQSCNHIIIKMPECDYDAEKFCKVFINDSLNILNKNVNITIKSASKSLWQKLCKMKSNNTQIGGISLRQKQNLFTDLFMYREQGIESSHSSISFKLTDITPLTVVVVAEKDNKITMHNVAQKNIIIVYGFLSKVFGRNFAKNIPLDIWKLIVKLYAPYMNVNYNQQQKSIAYCVADTWDTIVKNILSVDAFKSSAKGSISLLHDGGYVDASNWGSCILTSTNFTILKVTHRILADIYREVKLNFSVEIAKEFDKYIRENDFDIDSIRDDIENLEDSFLISEMAEQFDWENNIREQSRFRLIIQNVLNPEISDLTKMKSMICRNNIPSELLVYGYLRDLESSQIMINNNSKSYRIISIIPDGVMKLCVRYYQTITVYGVGRNDRGEFGIPGKNNFMELTELEWITKNGSEFILSSIIPCTINGIAYISKDRDLWICGFNKYGQFGLNHCENIIDIAVQHPFYYKNNLKIKDVSHGKRAYHMFVTCINNKTKQIELYCHGANEWGQCGINRQILKEMEPVLMDISIFKLNKLNQKQNENVIDISCGIEHSLFLTLNGNIYSCGHNKWGQLGFKNHGYNGVQQLLIPTLIIFDNQINVCVKSINCGDSNCYCIDNKGNLWSWGRNEFGELGIGEKNLRLRWEPKEIEFFKNNKIKIFKICCGSDHVLVLDVFGKVYSWGFGKYGCCGNNDTKHIYSPQQILALDRYNIVDISCGSTHSIAVSDKRDIWSWGYNTMNQCCSDTFNPNRWFNTCKEIKSPRMVNTAVTKIISDMANVIGVRTATNSTLFIVEPQLKQ